MGPQLRYEPRRCIVSQDSSQPRVVNGSTCFTQVAAGSASTSRDNDKSVNLREFMLLLKDCGLTEDGSVSVRDGLKVSMGTISGGRDTTSIRVHVYIQAIVIRVCTERYRYLSFGSASRFICMREKAWLARACRSG